jgi:hypothetical protein
MKRFHELIISLDDLFHGDLSILILVYQMELQFRKQNHEDLQNSTILIHLIQPRF